MLFVNCLCLLCSVPVPARLCTYFGPKRVNQWPSGSVNVAAQESPVT